METDEIEIPAFTEEEYKAIAEIVSREEWKHVDKLFRSAMNKYAMHCLLDIPGIPIGDLKFKMGKYHAIKDLITAIERIKNPEKYDMKPRVSGTRAGY